MLHNEVLYLTFVSNLSLSVDRERLLVVRRWVGVKLFHKKLFWKFSVACAGEDQWWCTILHPWIIGSYKLPLFSCRKNDKQETRKGTKRIVS